MELQEIDADDAADVERAAALVREVQAADTPWAHPTTTYRQEVAMRHGWDGQPGRYFLAHAAGELVGYGVLEGSDYDNRELAWLNVVVRPGRRREGHGSALLEALTERAVEAGRPVIGVFGWDSPGTRAFAEHVGFPLRSQEIMRRMTLRGPGAVDPGLVERLRAEAAAAAPAYELVEVVGRVPDDLIDPVAGLTAAINDAPIDDLEWEPEVYSAERVRAYETAMLASGYRMYRLLARHRETGELAGHTVVAVETERPEVGHQHDTAVLAAHRGHRLGLLLKARMVQWLAEAEPQVATLDTFNAESNDHMVSVNERLGYVVMARELQFQRRTTR